MTNLSNVPNLVRSSCRSPALHAQCELVVGDCVVLNFLFLWVVTVSS